MIFALFLIWVGISDYKEKGDLKRVVLKIFLGVVAWISLGLLFSFFT
ncbi:MAG: hypothetical protein KDK48_01805 [Chlamydiia bacterium]|nr:hypothetical protein [Chlamydiia bacterium]